MKPSMAGGPALPVPKRINSALPPVPCSTAAPPGLALAFPFSGTLAERRRPAFSRPRAGLDLTDMTHLLVIAHAPLASALRDAALHVFPDAASHVLALDVQAHVSPDAALLAARALLLPAAARALLLTDVLGATPSNVASRLAAETGSPLLAGANLPMLLKAITYRAEPLLELAARVREGGQQAIIRIEP